DLPLTRTSPVSTVILPETILSRVDFPAPFEPITVTKSPDLRLSETSFNATRSLMVPGKKVFVTFSMVSMILPLFRSGLHCLAFALPQRRDTFQQAPAREQQREHHEHSRDELHVVRVEPHCQCKVDDKTVDDRTDDHCKCRPPHG